MGALNDLIKDTSIPKMARVRQYFSLAHIRDLEAHLLKELSQDVFVQKILPSQRIAITAGSRGIDRMPLILKTVAAFVRERGAQPFLVPAMGSHGGATAEGQLEILRSYGITEEYIGAPILSSMEVETLCRLEDGTPVYMDKNAFHADGIIVVNRVKYHTLFHGKYESGLMKMMAVGLGKQRGAETIHAHGPTEISARVEAVGNAVLAHANILFGVATVENAFDKSCELTVIPPEEIPTAEPKLLRHSKRHMPQIYFKNLDLLIVDRIGKNISGSGMDPNITYTFTRESGLSSAQKARRICVLDLTDETHGCALGVGMADTTTRRVYEKFSFDATYPNALTTSILESAKIPAVFDNQKLAIQAAIHTILRTKTEDLRIVRIADSLHLEEIEISQGLAKEAINNNHVELLEPFHDLVFDINGNLF